MNSTQIFVRVRRVAMGGALAYTTPFTCGGGGREGGGVNKRTGTEPVFTVEEVLVVVVVVI